MLTSLCAALPAASLCAGTLLAHKRRHKTSAFGTLSHALVLRAGFDCDCSDCYKFSHLARSTLPSFPRHSSETSHSNDGVVIDDFFSSCRSLCSDRFFARLGRPGRPFLAAPPSPRSRVCRTAAQQDTSGSEERALGAGAADATAAAATGAVQPCHCFRTRPL